MRRVICWDGACDTRPEGGWRAHHRRVVALSVPLEHVGARVLRPEDAGMEQADDEALARVTKLDTLQK